MPSSGTYQTEGWARRFFENWRDALKWQRLKPYEKFAKHVAAERMISGLLVRRAFLSVSASRRKRGFGPIAR